MLLAANQINVNQISPNGLTLNQACKEKYIEIVKLLLEYNCDPFLKDE